MNKRRIIVFAALIFCASFATSSFGLDVPALNSSINDLAGMIPPPSAHELEDRLRAFRTRTGHAVVILTIPYLNGGEIQSFARAAFQKLELSDTELRNAVLLVVARKEHAVGLQVGSELQNLFPEPAASQKIYSHVSPYFDGLRPDLGLHAAVHYIFRVIQGQVRVDETSESEKLENRSMRGSGAGAIFAVLLAPYLAFVIGGLWGIYATKFGAHRPTRLFVGAVLGSGTAKLVAAGMSLIGNYSNGLWYFILAISIPLALFGSLTEFWMAGEWSGIPRVKDFSTRRKPEDKMGI